MEGLCRRCYLNWFIWFREMLIIVFSQLLEVSYFAYLSEFSINHFSTMFWNWNFPMVLSKRRGVRALKNIMLRIFLFFLKNNVFFDPLHIVGPCFFGVLGQCLPVGRLLHTLWNREKYRFFSSKLERVDAYTYSSLTEGAWTLGSRNQLKNGETRSSTTGVFSTTMWYTSWKHNTQ